MRRPPLQLQVPRAARPADRSELARMLQALLAADGVTQAQAVAEVRKWFSGPQGTFVIDRGDGRLGGFVHIGERVYAEGCESSPVAFVEEWFVDRDLRRKGVGRTLMAAAEQWARDEGHSELASDTQLSNTRSQHAHRRLGFTVAEKLVSFRKTL